jgi:hypothetical protein
MDGNGQRTSAYSYAQELFRKADGNLKKFVRLLASYDEAVAIQAASLLLEKGWTLSGPEITSALQQATKTVKKGFREFISEWRFSQREP